MVNVILILAIYFAMASGIGGVVFFYFFVNGSRRKVRRQGVPEPLLVSLDGPSEPSRIDLEERVLVDSELDQLRLQVWRSRRRRVRLMGRVFLAGGLVALAAGYVSGYFGLELIAGVMIPVGVFFSFASNEPYMKSSLASQSVVSTMRVLQEALKINQDSGHAVFQPGDGEERNVRMFIPSADLPNGIPQSAGTLGHFYTPLGHEVFLSYVRETGRKPEGDLELLLDQLRTLMTTGLELVDDVRFTIRDSVVEVRVKNPTFAEIGRYPELVRDVYARAGCPLTNSMAEWLAYGLDCDVEWIDAQIDSAERSATVWLSLKQSKIA